MNSNIKKMLTFDIEHWYEGYRYRGINAYKTLNYDDSKFLEKLLNLLEKYHQHATFFITGRFVKQYSEIVKYIVSQGHEIASHSYDHKLITSLFSRKEFSYDLQRSLEIIEDVTGCSVRGYRAPKWSVNTDNKIWVLNELVRRGILYDSSLFPKRGTDYVTCGGEAHRVFLPSGKSIIEVPVTSFKFGGAYVPLGGAYFRILPFWITKAKFKSLDNSSRGGMLFLHLYDLDPEAPKVYAGSLIFKIVRSYGVDNAFYNLEHLLKIFKFTSILDQINNIDFLPSS